MAKLIECKDCGNKISKNAESCPHCGAKNKHTSIITWLALVFIGIPVLWSVFSGAADDTTSEPVVEVEEVSPSETLEVFELHEDDFDKNARDAVKLAQMIITEKMENSSSVDFRNMVYVKPKKSLAASVCGEVANGAGVYKSFLLIPSQGFYSIDDGTPEFKEAYNGFCTLK